jgi:hypothetical protein
MQAMCRWGVGILAMLWLLASASVAQTPTPARTANLKAIQATANRMEKDAGASKRG